MQNYRKSGEMKADAIEFKQGEVVIIYKNRALLGKNPGRGVVPQLIKGLWLRAENWFAREERRGLTSGIDGMWRDAQRKHPQYFIAL